MEKNFRVFVSRPFDRQGDAEKYWKLLLVKGILPCAEMLSKKSEYKIKFYDAESECTVDDVPEKLSLALDDSDIFLCILSEYRPSVLFETGYARKLGMPCVYMLDQKDSKEKIPIVIGVPDTYYYDSNNNNFDLIPGKLCEYLINACAKAELRKQRISHKYMSNIYQVKCYKDRVTLKFPQIIKNAKKMIKILTTNIDYFVNPDEQLAPEDRFDPEIFENSLKNQVKIIVLTMDPDSNLVVERSKQIDPAFRDDVYKYREELRQAIQMFYRRFESQILKGDLNLKLYDTLPTQMIYIVDDHVYVPSMAGHMRSRKCIHVEFKNNFPGVNDTFIHHFETVFREAKPIKLFSSWINPEAKIKSKS